jgi:Flp pilus assembly protein TadB
MVALVVCLALGGLYVVIRYIGQYLFYAALILLLLAGVYLYGRRPEDARRLRRFLADQGRRFFNWLWG